MSSMTKEEKIYLVYCLLYDVRMNWSDSVKERVTLAKDLCKELQGDFNILADRCDEFLSQVDIDGRFFRRKFPQGYQYLDSLSNTSRCLHDKSAEFQNYVEEYLTYPEYCFDD